MRLQSHRFTVTDFYRMADVGILGPEDRVELIDGEVVEMNPIGSRQAACVRRLNQLLSAGAQGAIVSVQDPVRLGDLSEPQPDLAILRPRKDFYSGSHPTPADVLLLVEVADSSLAFDLEIKLPLYAASGIPEVWIVDLQQSKVTSFSAPESGRYEQIRQFLPNERMAPLHLPDVELRAADIF